MLCIYVYACLDLLALPAGNGEPIPLVFCLFFKEYLIHASWMKRGFWGAFLTTRVLNQLKSPPAVLCFASPSFPLQQQRDGKRWKGLGLVGLLGQVISWIPGRRSFQMYPHYWALKVYPQNMVYLTRTVSVVEDSEHLGPQFCTVKESGCFLHLQGNLVKMGAEPYFYPPSATQKFISNPYKRDDDDLCVLVFFTERVLW